MKAKLASIRFTYSTEDDPNTEHSLPLSVVRGFQRIGDVTTVRLERMGSEQLDELEIDGRLGETIFNTLKAFATSNIT